MYKVTEEALLEIETSLSKLKSDFNMQLSAMEKDVDGFHKAMIDLTAKYPEHKELVQFIVLVNDKLETKQENYAELVSDSFTELINVKMNLVKAIKRKNSMDTKPEVSDSKEKVGFFKRIYLNTKFIGDLKITLLSIAAILIAILIFISPDILMTVMKMIAEMVL